MLILPKQQHSLLLSIQSLRSRSVKALLFALLASSTAGRAETFFDDFSFGLRPGCWAVLQSTPDFYSVTPLNGNIYLAKGSISNPGGVQYVFVRLNLAEFGGAVAGDFSTQINFSEAVVPGPGLDQVELHTYYEDGSIFYAVYDRSSGLNAHVWDGGSVRGAIPASENSGTFAISRVGATVSATYNGTLLYSTDRSSPLQNVDFVLQNNAGSDDPISVVYDNFAFTAASLIPELHIRSLSGQKIELSWSTDSFGYVLEETDTLVSWSPVSPFAPLISNGRKVVTLDAQTAPQFYRLRKTSFL